MFWVLLCHKTCIHSFFFTSHPFIYLHLTPVANAIFQAGVHPIHSCHLLFLHQYLMGLFVVGEGGAGVVIKL